MQNVGVPLPCVLLGYKKKHAPLAQANAHQHQQQQHMQIQISAAIRKYTPPPARKKYTHACIELGAERMDEWDALVGVRWGGRGW